VSHTHTKKKDEMLYENRPRQAYTLALQFRIHTKYNVRRITIISGE